MEHETHNMHKLLAASYLRASLIIYAKVKL